MCYLGVTKRLHNLSSAYYFTAKPKADTIETHENIVQMKVMFRKPSLASFYKEFRVNEAKINQMYAFTYQGQCTDQNCRCTDNAAFVWGAERLYNSNV